MNEKEIKKLIKKSKRPCGACGEVDTILFCCECMRKIREEDKSKRNAEVKQAIEGLMPTNAPEYVEEVFGAGLVAQKGILKELLKELGLEK